MSTWEQTKRAAQTAFINRDDHVQAAPASVDNFYRQITARGAIYQLTDRIPISSTIEDHFKALAHQLDAYMEAEKAQALEPER
jgi:hypothetical protein